VSARLAPEFLSVSEAARILAVSEKVVRAEIRRGRLPEYRVGRLVRIRYADLDRLRCDHAELDRLLEAGS
jgi:excisionase family DNA binding protein